MSFPELYQMVWDLQGSLEFWQIIIVLAYVLCGLALGLSIYVLVKLKDLEEPKESKKELRKK